MGSGLNLAPPKALKPHFTFAQQLATLTARGLVVADDAAALQTLERLGYYRLAGYFYPLRQTNPVGTPGRQDPFQPGAAFDLVARLYEFDKALRLLVLDGIERIEVAVRVAIAYELGKRDPRAHLDAKWLDGRFTSPPKKRPAERSQHQIWLEKLNAAVAKSNEEFVQHHRAHYGGQMPIWVAIEVWDFGMTSRFYAGMQMRDQRRIAQKYGLPDGKYMMTWLRTLNLVRNVCAHHSRLWNRNIQEKPSVPPAATHPILKHLHEDSAAISRIYGALACMRYLLRTIAPQCDWHEQLKRLVSTFPATELLSISGGGFPGDWEEMQLWA